MLETRMPGFYDELSKIAHELTLGERTDFAQPKKEEEGHKGKYPIPDKKHYGIALGFAKMHHDSGALAAIHAKGKKMGYDGKDKEAGLKNLIMGLGAASTIAGGGAAIAHKATHLAKPAAQVVKAAPRMIGSQSSQMADLAREGVKFASRRSS